jgi:hypothetical protein
VDVLEILYMTYKNQVNVLYRRDKYRVYVTDFLKLGMYETYQLPAAAATFKGLSKTGKNVRNTWLYLIISNKQFLFLSMRYETYPSISSDAL